MQSVCVDMAINWDMLLQIVYSVAIYANAEIHSEFHLFYSKNYKVDSD